MGFGIFLSPLWDNNFYAGENTEVGKKPKLVYTEVGKILEEGKTY